MGNVPITNGAGSGGKHSTTVAVATGFLALSSAGFALIAWLFYDRVNRATRLDSLKESFYNIEQLNSAIDSLRKEIDELKAIKSLRRQSSVDDDTASRKSSKVVRFKNKLSVISSDETEYQSAWSGNDSSEEFFDFDENDLEELLEDKQELVSTQEEALQIFEKVDILMEGTSKEHELAFALLTSYENEYGNNVEFLWRIAKACRMVAAISEDPKKKKNLFYKAVDYAKRSLNADERNAEAHKWLAISLGSLGDYLGVSEKIKNGVLFKEHLDIAISINPTDPILHHLLGRFSYEVSTLSWIERKVATTLFTKMPSGSIESALDHFKNAEKLRIKPWKENRLFLARCFIQLGKYSDAVYWIDAALPIPVLTAEDQISQKELMTLQGKYNGYRRS